MNANLIWRIPLFVLVGGWGIYFWSVTSAQHRENMAKLRRRWRSRRGRASQHQELVVKRTIAFRASNRAFLLNLGTLIYRSRERQVSRKYNEPLNCHDTRLASFDRFPSYSSFKGPIWPI